MQISAWKRGILISFNSEWAQIGEKKRELCRRLRISHLAQFYLLFPRIPNSILERFNLFVFFLGFIKFWIFMKFHSRPWVLWGFSLFKSFNQLSFCSKPQGCNRIPVALFNVLFLSSFCLCSSSVNQSLNFA